MPGSTEPMVVAPVRSRSVTEVLRMVSVPTTLSDAERAAALAYEAGQLLVSVRAGHPGADPAELKGLGDRSSQDLLAQRLAQWCPDDAVLSEEAADDLRRLDADRVWIIDPLDGTREYSEGRHDWAVHVALWADGDLAAGAVALPGLDLVLGTDPAPVVPPPSGGPGARLRMAVSRTRPPAVAERLVERPRGRTVRVGLGGPGRRGPGSRAARLPAGRVAVAVQPPRRPPARPGGVPARACGPCADDDLGG